MRKKHKVVLTIIIVVTIIAFILFNLDYKEGMLLNAIQFSNQPELN